MSSMRDVEDEGREAWEAYQRRALTDAQVDEAIEQMKSHCGLLMEEYELVSARAALYTLGYHGEDAEQVLKDIYDRGFTYCFDHRYISTWYDGDKEVKEYPSEDVCYWGPDQLKSRLNSIRSR